MTKLDLKQQLKPLYHAYADQVTMVEVPPLHFLMAEGQGDPNTRPEFPLAAETLFKLSFTLKFMLKKAVGLDYTVMPVEGLWCMADGSQFNPARPNLWRWTLMLLQPDAVTPEWVDKGLAQLRAKKPAPRLYPSVFRRFAEGQAAQILHTGPYAAEAPTIARLHAFIKEKGYHFAGKHHEIYLSDPRRTAPEKLKTILRQPITLEAQR
jgi:hypothetical protein